MPAASPEPIGPNSEVVRDWLAEYVYETMRTETIEQIVDRLDNAIIARVPELADRDVHRDLAASTRAHARVMLSGITSDTFEYALPEEAHTFARTLARRGFELRMLLRTYHVGMEAVLDYMTDTIELRPAPQEIERAVMLRLFERATKWVSLSVELLTDTYMEERERVLRAALNRRTETIRALLAGDELDLDQASARLGYRLQQRHLAFVLWTDESETGGGDGEVVGLLERVATKVAAGIGTGRVLTVASGSSGMWAWAGLDELAAAEAARIEREHGALERIAAGVVESPVRIAFGVPGGQVAGFRQSHREAVAARHVAERGPAGAARVTGYREVEIAYLAGADDAAMRGLIGRELRTLSGADPNAARLRETLHAYLKSHRSPEATAKLLGVHKNTVRYRIQRIEELLGHPIEQRSLPLEVALACVAAYGADALP
ncbi:DNA-binding PucR family transcriptional regulator [Nocardia tenerifensis]|uniref:DNA-binding PucR family transcriptional regulator n=1 Tax=Nocardia tenerifensis TaxID=228006 RepID=A0A318K560_9NOCA|nr:helix-turn-helix domain-containing protein [Nocardia tenerifensis]PXX63353.1 DNA-binding PucR family transcriptional regulator [Nocardia tenerifensis]